MRKHTSIPVPRVWAHGKHALLPSDPQAAQPYLLCDFIAGQAVTMKRIVNATPKERMGFFADLVGIYAQLYKLRFSVAGSPMPSVDGDVGPHVGGLLTMAGNELQLSTRNDLPKPRILYSAKSYVQYQLDVLAKSSRLPLIDARLQDARDQLFAVHHVELKVHELASDSQSDNTDPFILTHPDLHYGNIIVDENFRIQGVIDWEFTGPVPQWQFTPPAWVTGHDGHGILGPPLEITGDFQKALEMSEHKELKNHWKKSGGSDSLFATAQILCRPTKLQRLFDDFLFPGINDSSQDDMISRFFADQKNTALAEEADQLLSASKRYTAYLKANGLFDDIEEEETRLAEISAKMCQILDM